MVVAKAHAGSPNQQRSRSGTPIAKTEQGEGTFNIFGTQDERGYLDKYSIKELIEDETTLPIKHVMAPSEMTVPAERLDKEFFKLADAEGITDVEELNKVLDRAVGLRTFLMADDRVEKVAAFIAEHFKENVFPLGYKAFVVAVNREACAKYKKALDKLVPPEWTVPVYTENAADIVDRPLVAELQLSEEREEDVRTLFKKADKDPKILIVTDKLLTGYDAPLLYCLYLDKPMRDHVLLQAVARVNRPFVDGLGVQKRVGLVVDFVGVLRELKKALQFDSADVSGVIEDLDVLLGDFKQKIAKPRRITSMPGKAAMPTSGWSAWSMDASSNRRRVRRFSRPTKTSKAFGKSCHRRPSYAITSQASNASRNSTPPFEMPMPKRSASLPIWPTRPGG